MKEPARFPGSIATQAQVVFEELSRIEYLRTRCALKQQAHEHEDDHDYVPLDDDGEVVTYEAYRKGLDAFEKRLRDITPPAALRLAEKRLKEQAAQNGA